MTLFTTALGLYGGVLSVVCCAAVSSRDPLYIIHETMAEAEAGGGGRGRGAMAMGDAL
jgi:hypothetical protein